MPPDLLVDVTCIGCGHRQHVETDFSTMAQLSVGAASWLCEECSKSVDALLEGPIPEVLN